MAENTWKTYETAVESLERFCAEYSLICCWPVKLDHLIKFIAYLSYSGYKASTVVTYVSDTSYKHKLLGLDNVTDNFLVYKMLEGLRRYSCACYIGYVTQAYSSSSVSL